MSIQGWFPLALTGSILMGWMLSPNVHMLKSYPLAPQNRTSFGNRIIADVISKDKVELEQGGSSALYD